MHLSLSVDEQDIQLLTYLATTTRDVDQEGVYMGVRVAAPSFSRTHQSRNFHFNLPLSPV